MRNKEDRAFSVQKACREAIPIIKKERTIRRESIARQRSMIGKIAAKNNITPITLKSILNISSNEY